MEALKGLLSQNPNGWIPKSVQDERLKTTTSTDSLTRIRNHEKNRNMDSEKYSLRQRQKRKHFLANALDNQDYNSDNSSESGQHGLNSVKNFTIQSNCSSGKAKSKAAPLSKYRRKTANARERTRMREINTAFENLRHCVPSCITNEDAGATNEKLTKITTLRLAMKYIRILSEALTKPDEADYELLYDCTQAKLYSSAINNNQATLSTTTTTSTTELTKIEKGSNEKICTKRKANKVKMKNNAEKQKNNTITSRKTLTKRQSKKQKPIDTQQNYYTSPASLRCQESPLSNISSAYASLSSDFSASPLSNSSYAYESNQNMTANFIYTPNNHHQQNYQNPNHYKTGSVENNNSLLLESDGESLNLSESCLSPLQTTNRTCSNMIKPYENANKELTSLENPLELSLRLVEPTHDDSLSFTIDQVDPPPSACISPLMALEPFNPFDLFHADLAEQTALDLFLT
uniref:BHLH domain-containing protein n=1 Tax=Glossina brevipalpis TaxID=37001 RepID=A0A1A9WH77_9MUSC